MNVPDRAPRRVLVVDDHVDAAQSFAEVFSAMGHHAIYVTKPEAAIHAAREFSPELVTLDIGMPGINGYDLARSLRAEFGRNVRLVAITGHGTDADRARSREAGFDAHLVKPVETKTLQAILDNMPSRL